MSYVHTCVADSISDRQSTQKSWEIGIEKKVPEVVVKSVMSLCDRANINSGWGQ